LLFLLPSKRFPGILPRDDIIGLLNLKASKNPSNDIAAKIALDGGYDPCSKFQENESLWIQNLGCHPGFIPDHKNGYCYFVLPSKENLEDGENICRSDFDAELLLFDRNSEVVGLIKLIGAGEFLCSIVYNSISQLFGFTVPVDALFLSYNPSHKFIVSCFPQICLEVCFQIKILRPYSHETFSHTILR